MNRRIAEALEILNRFLSGSKPESQKVALCKCSSTLIEIPNNSGVSIVTNSLLEARRIVEAYYGFQILSGVWPIIAGAERIHGPGAGFTALREFQHISNNSSAPGAGLLLLRLVPGYYAEQHEL